MLRFLARALTDASVMIVTTYRNDELTRRHPLRPLLRSRRLPGTVRVDVPNLERAEVAELLTQLMERPPSNVIIDLVYRRSEGSRTSSKSSPDRPLRGCIDMPDTLRDALNVRGFPSPEPSSRPCSWRRSRVPVLIMSCWRRRPTPRMGSWRVNCGRQMTLGSSTGTRLVTASARVAARGGPRRPAAWPARSDACPLRKDFGGAPRADERGGRSLGDRPSLECGARGQQGLPMGIHRRESGSAAFHEALKLYERALELWDQVDDPESVAGTHASLLMRAAYAAEDAGEVERALALVNAALDELDAKDELSSASRR